VPKKKSTEGTEQPVESSAEQAAEAAETAVPEIEPPEATEPPLVEAPDAPGEESADQRRTITDHLITDSEYDPSATSDDKLLAAIAYGSQLIFPLGFVVPVILLISETSKQRAFQHYHAVQSLALGIVVWLLLGGLSIMATIAGASIVGILCLCFIGPAMILIWLLPLYYALLALNGKRFRIPGLTQFLEDQRWL
jgi:uncharacterized membrane protein